MPYQPTQPRRPWLQALRVLGGIAVGAFAVIGLVCFFADFGGTCCNDKLSETLSPNGQLKAVTFRRNCGATSDYSTHVSILSAGRKLPNDAGNVFTASHERSITVRWLDDQHLSISGETQTTLLHLSEFRDVQISYQ